MENKKTNLKQIIDFRIQKLNNIIESKINPYPSNYNRTHKINYVVNNENTLLDKEISIAGRIVSLRNMGKVSFINIQDDGSKIQLFIKKDNLIENLYNDLVKKIDIGDIVGCKGELFYTKTNELSLRANDFTMLAKSIRPLPNLKEKDGKVFFSFDDTELRYRKRYLDIIANQHVKDVFVKRAKIINAVRSYLNNDGYIEVETPILQPLYGGANAKPFKTYHNSLNQDFYLRIADELYLKRLIIGGFEKVYEISKNFRNEGIDKNHNPEFTMLEFYSSFSDVERMMDFTENMLKNVVSTISSDKIVEFKGQKICFNESFSKVDYFKIIKKESGINIENVKLSELKNFLTKNKIEITKSSNKFNLLDKIFSIYVEPKLIQPTFVYNYPIELSPLAKKKKNSPNIVDRFELFIGGMEIANAFSELNDPIDQRNRLKEQSNLRDLGDDEAQTLDEDFIEAMEYGMPPTGGVGLGIDRLCMILSSQDSIKDVILFPTLKSEE